MKINDIRTSFLEFYKGKGHTLIPSASLVPVADPSLLLINAGMAPLKRYFMGHEEPPAPRCTSSQKCIRTIDIEQVGYTNRHNTFFEMLGKFSFGDYFKLQAMQYTLEWMTSKDWLGLNKERIYITHHEKDEESRELWAKELGWPESRLFGLGDKDNLWAAGDTGPWGYDTEYFYDFAPDGQELSTEQFVELSESGRIVEVGNDVFMQFNRTADGKDVSLPRKNVDFGGGLERFAMALQSADTVYRTDAMDYLINGFAEVVAEHSGNTPSEDELFSLGSAGFNPYWLAADHIRSATFLLSDGVTPGNTGRNYVLRRLIRRIIAQAFRLGVKGPFIMKLADLVIDKMGEHYVDLRQKRDSLIKPWIDKEEAQFFDIMESGYGRLLEQIEQAKESGKPVSGEFVFELYDTYGFPGDLAMAISREYGVEVARDGFEREMAAQKERARGAAKFVSDMGEQETAGEVVFLGYESTGAQAKVVQLEPVPDLRGIAPLIAGQPDKKQPPVSGVKVHTDQTPFYNDAGGQPSDSGILVHGGKKYTAQSAAVRGIHYVLGSPEIKVGEEIELIVDRGRRDSLRRPHTTNHLMLGALKEVLGEHVNQAGSQLGEDEIRFDFSHFQALAPEEISRVEEIVNHHIIADWPVTWVNMPLVEAKNMGVTAVFDEKYGADVRVVSIGNGQPDNLSGWVSRELCGGTHLERTSQAGMFLIVKEESVQSGIRRIYAIVGHKALGYVKAAKQVVDWFGTHYKRPMPNPAGTPVTELDTYELKTAEWREEIVGNILRTEREGREAQQAAVEARREVALGSLMPALQAEVTESNGLSILVTSVDIADRSDLKYLVERFAGGAWQENYVVFVAANVAGKAALSCKVSREAIERGIKASELVREAAKLCKGGGGGKPDFAEAGGKDGSKVVEAADFARSKITEFLSG